MIGNLQRANQRMSTSRSLVRAALAAALLAPAAVRAQAPGQGSWVLRVGNDTVAVERFTRAADRLEGDVAVRGRALIRYAARLAADGSVPSLEFRVWGWGAPDSAAPLQHGSVAVTGDSARVQAFAGGAAVILNPSAALTEQLLMRARALGGRDSVTVPAR